MENSGESAVNEHNVLAVAIFHDVYAQAEVFQSKNLAKGNESCGGALAMVGGAHKNPEASSVITQMRQDLAIHFGGNYSKYSMRM